MSELVALPFADRRINDGSWLQTRRDEAWNRFSAAGLPAAGDERWLNTDPEAYVAPATGSTTTEAPDLGLPRIVATDGIWQIPDDLPVGFRVLPLDHDDEVNRVHADAIDTADRDAFSDLNTACFQGGLLIDVPEGVEVGPLHLVHINTGTTAFPRLVVHVQDGGGLTFVEHHVGAGTTIATTEVHAHHSAHVRRDMLQQVDGRHIHNVYIRQDRDAAVHDTAVHLGADHGRSTLIAHLGGQGAHVELTGLYLVDGQRRSDHWTRVDHAVPDCTSREVYKGVLAGSSRGGFTGNVLVRPDAQRTSAEQENRNLLLSDKALAASTPQLEIHADDVQCSHGSTVGQLDEKALFFLRARGIPRDQAEALLTKAFAGEVVDAFAVPAVAKHVTAHIEAWFNARAGGGS